MRNLWLSRTPNLLEKRKLNQAFKTSNLEVAQRVSQEEHIPLIEFGSNFLEFWKINAIYFPVLAAVAKEYLSVQAFCVSAERAFSSGTDLVNAE